MKRKKLPPNRDAIGAKGIRVTRMTGAEYQRLRKTEKKELRIFEWHDADRLQFPGYFTIHMEYFATGEGLTRGLTFCRAIDAKQLRSVADEDFGAYFAEGSEIRQGFDPLPNFADLVPAAVAMTIAKRVLGKVGLVPHFHFTTQLHQNYS